MARKEWIQLRRDPRSMLLAFLLPLMLLLFFGYAITWDIKHIRLAVYDADGSRSARDLVQAFEASSYFDLADRLRSYPEVDRELETGRALAVMSIPPGVQRASQGRRSGAGAAPAGRERRQYRHHRDGICRRHRRPLQPAGPLAGAARWRPRSRPRAESGTTQSSQSEHDRPRARGGDHVDHRRDAHRAHHRPRVGAGDDGAAGLDSRAPARGGAGEADSLPRHRTGRRDHRRAGLGSSSLACRSGAILSSSAFSPCCS